MNLPILLALSGLTFVEPLPESTLIDNKGPVSLFLAADPDEFGGGRYFPTDAEPIYNDDNGGVDTKVRDLIRREIQAGQLLFGAAQQSELEARGALLIEWLDQRRLPAPDQVDQLEERVNQWEERVTERLSRDYRILVYNTYRTDREQFNHRRARWKLIDDRWRKFEHTPQRRAHLNQWLAEAIEVSRPGSTTPLPPAPAWYYEPLEMLAQQDDSEDVFASAGDPFDVSSPGDFVDSSMLHTPEDVSAAQRQFDDSVVEAEEIDPFVADEVVSAGNGIESEGYESEYGETQYDAYGDDSEVDSSSDAVPDEFDAAQTSSLPENRTQHDTDEAPHVEIDLIELAEDERANEQRETAVVNVDLLAARIAGHNLAVLRLADELGGRDQWTAPTLAPHVDRLIDLHERRRDLVLFLELTEQERRADFQPIETTRQSVTLLAEKIVGARLWAMGNEFQGNSQQRQAELAALADFSRRLAEIAFDNPRPLDARIR
jgi:hypothetical protein